jgi:GR25 family glycosyltransferase involved in LPS biosynthesis
MGINEYFDKVYCINLDERVDRWELAQKEFEKINILDQVERWSGIKHTDGNLGCTLSHLTLIKKCKEDGLENVLIFEDDVLFVETDIKRLEEAFKDLKSIGKWDLFYVGVTMCPRTGRFTRVTDRILKTNFAFTTHAYAANAQAFDYMIEAWTSSTSRGYNIVDTVLDNHIVKRRGQSFVMDPIYAIQQPGLSDITNIVSETYEWMIRDFNTVKNKSGLN